MGSIFGCVVDFILFFFFSVNDSVQSLKNMTLDSLVSIVRSLGADEAKCYSRMDFINCIINIMHGVRHCCYSKIKICVPS